MKEKEEKEGEEKHGNTNENATRSKPAYNEVTLELFNLFLRLFCGGWTYYNSLLGGRQNGNTALSPVCQEVTVNARC